MQREERRNSIAERCGKACQIVEDHEGPSVIWCELNDEGDFLEDLIPNAHQVKGAMPDQEKEEMLQAFTDGEINRLITKPKIGAWGLNWQHCRNVVSLPSHSFERYYQSVRRCWRFGQTEEVHVHRIVNEGERAVLDNLRDKAEQADHMFSSLVKHMNDALEVNVDDSHRLEVNQPNWMECHVSN
jgi:SNF2 family DNA or RNA helicase